MLPSLLRKAVGDAGFDLPHSDEGGWARFGISGVDGSVWITPDGAGALFAIDSPAVLRDFASLADRRVTPPSGAVGVVRCGSARELYDCLRRARVLFAQAPPRPERRVQERLRALGSTEKDALVRQRVGQDVFREMLMEYWDGRCAVTGLDVPELLRASHVKPWKDCTDEERLDVHNGFLLAVHLDALFDCGMMTFRSDGTAVFSSSLGPALRVFNLEGTRVSLRRISNAHGPYLAYHERHVFRA